MHITDASAHAGRPALRMPRTWALRSGDVVAVAAGNAVLIVGMWLRHGGLPNLASPAADLTALGQLTALLGTYAALLQIVVMSRSPWLDQLFGIDRIARWHRVMGFATVAMICAHAILSTAGYALADGSSVVAEAGVLLTTYPYVLMATAGTALLIMAAVTSVRAARRRVAYETWHFIHLYTYLAIALGFGHELAVGSDFEHDPVAAAYWIGLYAAVIACVLAFRLVAPLRLARRHRLRVVAMVPEARGVVSVYIGGRRLEDLPVRAGQFFKFRLLTADLWWRVHPFSLSASPNGEYLRVTVKAG